MAVMVALLAGCGNPGGNIVKEINIGIHNDNQLKIRMDITTTVPADVYAEYWSDSVAPGGGDSAGKAGNAGGGDSAGRVMTSTVSKNSESHRLVLINILPATNYSYHIITEHGGVRNVSKTYSFRSHDLPIWLKEQFKYSCDSLQLLPPVFKDGLMLMNKRETPGVAYIVDYKGRLRWYHMVDGTGFKVTHFTKDKTILSILGKNDEPTSYGSEILEINLYGDTLLHLKKGQGDFRQTIHHEILKNDKGQVLTLFVDQRIMDLRAVGGGQADTVNGDGILILDRQGKKVWQWSVFDVVDPLKDPKLLKTRRDWMHANSLNFDKDGNFIVSFYNNGQIWKVDAQTGKVLWKFGKGGTFVLPAECNFTQAHAVHINPAGSLMFYDNGVENRQSEVFALKLDEGKMTARMDLHIKLPREVYNDRMGSAYMINDTTVLCCCSKRHITLLTNLKGVLLWTLDTAIPPYRAEFLSREQVGPYLQP